MGPYFDSTKAPLPWRRAVAVDWQGRYEVLNLRSGKKGEVMLLDKADAKVLAAYSTTMVKESTPAAELEPVPIVAVAPPVRRRRRAPEANRAPAQPQRAKACFRAVSRPQSRRWRRAPTSTTRRRRQWSFTKTCTSMKHRARGTAAASSFTSVRGGRCLGLWILGRRCKGTRSGGG